MGRPAAVPDHERKNGEFSWTTYPERLQAAGVSWKFYHESLGNTGINPLLFFKQYNDAKPGDPLYDNAIANSPVGTFEYDVAHDQLPTVSWILPPAGLTSIPPTPGGWLDLRGGQDRRACLQPRGVGQDGVHLVLRRERRPVRPRRAPDPAAGTPDEFVTLTSQTGTAGGGLPVGLGFRVPCIIVSPWTVGGYVYSGLSDHTSQLKFLEQITGSRTNISAWRRKTVSDLTSAFRFNKPDLDPPALPDTNGQYNLAQYEIANLPMPAQPGRPRRCPSRGPAPVPVSASSQACRDRNPPPGRALSPGQGFPPQELRVRRIGTSWGITAPWRPSR